MQFLESGKTGSAKALNAEKQRKDLRKIKTLQNQNPHT
jgi:hypothetical protein